MNTRSFNEFHNARDKYVSSVADSVYFYFFTDDIFIDQNGLVFIDFNGGLKIVAKLIFVGNDLHRPSA